MPSPKNDYTHQKGNALGGYGLLGAFSLKGPTSRKGSGESSKGGGRGAGNSGGFQWGIYFAMVLGAFALWIITSLNNRFNYAYEVSLTYADHANARPMGILPTSTNLTVQGRGYAHLRFFFFGPRVIRNLRLPSAERETTLDFETVFSMNKGAMRGLEVKSADPANITYFTEKLISKPIKIKVSGDIRAKAGFSMEAPRPNPDRVLVRAPKGLLDTLQFIYTEPFDTSQVQTSFTRQLTLKYPVGVTMAGQAKTVKIAFPVGRITEAVRTLKLDVRNSSSRISANPNSNQVVGTKGVQVYPSTIKVTISTSIDEYSRVMAMPLRVYVDLADIKESYNNEVKAPGVFQSSRLRLPIHIEGLDNTFEPKQIRLSPDEVEWFLVE